MSSTNLYKIELQMKHIHNKLNVCTYEINNLKKKNSILESKNTHLENIVKQLIKKNSESNITLNKKDLESLRKNLSIN